MSVNSILSNPSIISAISADINNVSSGNLAFQSQQHSAFSFGSTYSAVVSDQTVTLNINLSGLSFTANDSNTYSFLSAFPPVPPPSRNLQENGNFIQLNSSGNVTGNIGAQILLYSVGTVLIELNNAVINNDTYKFGLWFNNNVSTYDIIFTYPRV